MSRRKTTGLFAYSWLDAIPVACGVLHLAYLLGWFAVSARLPWWVNALLGAVYAVSISWNINGISHNFIHNPYFRSETLNRAFSVLESLACGFGQTFYRCIHMQHHMGNADRPSDDGRTIDPLSIYKHGHEGKPENVWSYTFLSFFRDDPKQIYRDIARKSRAEANFGVLEIGLFLALFTTLGVLDWRFVLWLLPSWYLGHCLSYLNGYFEHYAGNPDVPIAWGVSTYHRLYNLLWFNNGYHAEHHYRPRMHWTKMRELHERIEQEQREAGTRVIRPPHALGFLDPELPTLAELGAPAATPSNAERVGASGVAPVVVSPAAAGQAEHAGARR